MLSKKIVQTFGVIFTQQYLTLLTKERKRAKLKKKQAAILAGCSPQTVSSVENRTRGVSLPMAAQLAVGLGRLPSDIMEDVQEAMGIKDVADLLRLDDKEPPALS